MNDYNLSNSLNNPLNYPNTEQNALKLSKEGKLKYIQIKDYENAQLVDYRVGVIKAFSFQGIALKARAILTRLKVVKIELRDPETGKQSKYYARFDAIFSHFAAMEWKKNESIPTNIRDHNLSETIKKLKQDAPKEHGNDESVEEALSETIKKIQNEAPKIDFNDQFLKNQLSHAKKVMGTSNVAVILFEASQELPSDKSMSTHKFSILFSKILNQAFLKKIEGQYHLNPDQLESLTHLTAMVPSENLAKALEGSDSPIKLLRTYLKAGEELKLKGRPDKQHYVKKDKQSLDGHYSFTISKDMDFIVSMEEMAKGTSKKVSNALNITDYTVVVKKSVSSKKKIAPTEQEYALQLELSKTNPYVIKPYSISFKVASQSKGRKLISFEKQMVQATTLRDSNQLNKIAQFFYDYATGLSYLHKSKYVHGDVKAENALLKEGRAFLADFGSTKEEGLSPINEFGSPMFYAPEKNRYTPLSPAMDNYALGVALIEILNSDFEEAFPSREKNEFLSSLNQTELDQFFENFKNLEMTTHLSKEDLLKRNQIIDIAKKLTAIHVNERMTAKEAAEEIKKIFPNVITTPPEQ